MRETTVRQSAKRQGARGRRQHRADDVREKPRCEQCDEGAVHRSVRNTLTSNLSPLTSRERLIVHVDVDAFFASVEQLLIPALRSRPVIVGSGCIASCSYEARRFGLHAGMSLRQARRLCPQAQVMGGRQAIYRCFAEHIWQVCRRYACDLETFLDEAYGDAGGVTAIGGRPETFGRALRAEVLDEVGLSVSVGLGVNRMMAKIASRLAKPAGVRWVAPGDARGLLAEMPVESLPGVGRKTAERLGDLNIATVGRLRCLSREVLRAMFGRRGEILYERSRGRDTQQPATRAGPKTISRETTLHEPTCDLARIRAMLAYLVERAMRAARKLDLLVGAVELSIRYDDWKQYSARRRLDRPTSDDKTALAMVERLGGQLLGRRVAVRHVGIMLSALTPDIGQGELFPVEAETRRGDLTRAVDTIRDRWGHAAVVTGRSIALMGKLDQNDYGFILRTPSLTK